MYSTSVLYANKTSHYCAQCATNYHYILNFSLFDIYCTAVISFQRMICPKCASYYLKRHVSTFFML